MTITVARWREAQEAEQAYWYAPSQAVRSARRTEERARAQWIADLLGIVPSLVAGAAILDIGGGPQPIVAWPDLPLRVRVLVDPMPLSAADRQSLTAAHVHVVPIRAEDYSGPCLDEAWGYNVLQHVLNPAAVLGTAMTHARRVRWFEWVDQPTSVVHPHSVTVETLAPLDAWRRVAWVEGVRDEGRGWAQAYAAGVWERP